MSARRAPFRKQPDDRQKRQHLDRHGDDRQAAGGPRSYRIDDRDEEDAADRDRNDPASLRE
jgi:hypothetical protein